MTIAAHMVRLLAEVAAVTIADVRAHVKGLRTWFEEEEATSDFLLFSTRDHGDVGRERPGKLDVQEGRRIVQALREKFGSAVDVAVDTVDEWVSVTVELKPPPKQ